VFLRRTVSLAKGVHPPEHLFHKSLQFLPISSIPVWGLFAPYSATLNLLSSPQKGVGSALLELIIQYAREEDYECLTGFVSSSEIDVETLVHWYREHGFQVDDTGSRPTLYLGLQ